MTMCSFCTSVACTVLIVIDILGCAPLLLYMPAARYRSLTFGTFYRYKYRSVLRIAAQSSALKNFPSQFQKHIAHKDFLMHFGRRIKADVSLQPTLRPHDLQIK